MSQESVEYVARQIANGISNRDLAVLQANSDPDIEYTSRFTAVEGRTYRGHAGWSDYLADLESAWEEFEVTVDDVVPAGPEKLVAGIRVSAVARGSGVRIDESGYAAWELRRGKAVRGRTYSSQDEALKAMGLSQ